jgi:hypothetical protein
MVAHQASEAMSRRGSLRVVGGAALAGALTAPAVANGARDSDKDKVCKRLRTGCEEEVRSVCQGNKTCLNAVLPCCALLGRCKGRAATECFLSG